MGGDREAGIDAGATQLPECLLAGRDARARPGADRGERHLQRPRLIGFEVEPGQLVAVAVDPVGGRSGGVAALG